MLQKWPKCITENEKSRLPEFSLLIIFHIKEVRKLANGWIVSSSSLFLRFAIGWTTYAADWAILIRLYEMKYFKFRNSNLRLELSDIKWILH